MKHRSVEEKKELLKEHFLYEITMIEMIVKHHMDIRNSHIEDQFAKNIIVEIVTLHGRNLLEFFYHNKNKQDYAHAFHFMKKDVVWKDIRPEKTESIRILEKRVNLEITHLTYKRIAGLPEHKKWVLKILYDDLMKVVCIFVNNVAEEYFDDRLRDFKERFCS